MTNVRSLRVRVLLEFAFVCVVIVVPTLVQAGVLSLPELDKHTQASSVAASPFTNTLSASMNEELGQGGGDVLVSGGVLLASGPVGENEIATSGLTNGEIRVHTVREGDTLSQIAEMYSVTTNTVLWANDLTDATDIHAGDNLVILPIAGVQHVVEKGDTVAELAKKYDGDIDEIRAYNQLQTDESLSVGNTVVIPGGQLAQSTQVFSGSSGAPTPTSESGSVSSGGGFVHPAPGAVKTQGIHGYNAVDFGGAVGTAIKAAAAGEVIVSKSSGWNGGYGNYIVIRHPNGSQTLYAHNNKNYVGVGEYVTAGQDIATMGSTGRSTGSHVHFEVRGTRNPF